MYKAGEAMKNVDCTLKSCVNELKEIKIALIEDGRRRVEIETEQLKCLQQLYEAIRQL